MRKLGQTLKIFLADGVAEGLRTIEKSNWIGKCLTCTRAQFPKVKDRPEFAKTGVYLLYGLGLDDQPVIYVGEGDPVLDRILSHEREKDFWEHLVLFNSKDENLNKAHIQYLEARLVQLAKDAKKCRLMNGKLPTLPALSESDVADMEFFLENMILIYGVLGLSVFETPKIDMKDETSQITYLKGPNAEATGYEALEGFIVLKGAKATAIDSPSIPPAIKAVRAQMLIDGLFVLEKNSLVLEQDYTFSSPSKAAAVFLGRSSNGRVEWKSSAGITLKEIQDGR